MTGPGIYDDDDYYQCTRCNALISAQGLCDRCEWLETLVRHLPLEKWPEGVKHFDAEVRDHRRWLHAWIDVDATISARPLCTAVSMSDPRLKHPARASEAVLHDLLALLIDTKRNQAIDLYCPWRHEASE